LPKGSTDVSPMVVSFLLMLIIGVIVAFIIWQVVSKSGPQKPAPAVTPPAAACGNGFLEGGEECDDGNTASGDGCSSACRIEGTSAPQLTS